MKIQLISSYSSSMTGLKRYAVTIEDYLKKQGVSIMHAHPSSPIPPMIGALGKRMGYNLDAFFQNHPVRGNFEQADLYHITSETLASILRFQRLRPTIITVHGFFTYFLRNDPELAMKSHVFDRWFDDIAIYGFRQADAIISVSHYVKKMLVEHIKLPPDSIHVIHEAVDHEFFYPRTDLDEFKRKNGFDPDYKHILYVGSEQPRKNLSLLIRAFAQVKKSYEKVRLIKVGQPEMEAERQKVLQLIDSLGLKNDVIFCGHAGSELPYFYSAADIFTFPSKSEGFGFPPLEAMACGTPVVCSNVTSLPEVTNDAALLFDPFDADTLAQHLLSLLTDSNLHAAYHQRGLENASQFRWERSVKETAALYEATIHTKSKK